jgi:hypothetical protein
MMKSKPTVARPLCEGTPLERLIFDVEDRCGRAVQVLREAQERIVDLDGEQPLLLAALEMITEDLLVLARRAVEARSGPKAVA